VPEGLESVTTPNGRSSDHADTAAVPTGPPDLILSGVYIRQAAEMVGVSSGALRLWEKHGLIHPQRLRSGYRLYTFPDIERMRQIRRLQEEGVNPQGILRILDQSTANGGPLRTHGVSEAAALQTIGRRLRDLRIRKGLSLRELAARTGLSSSYISSIERSLSSPSVASMSKIAAELDTNVPALLGDSGRIPVNSPVVRANARRVMTAEGVQIEDLSTPAGNLEPLLMTVRYGAGSEGSYCHEGEEFLYMMSGSLEITLGGTEHHVLHAGDSMTFDSMRPHQWHNPDREDAVILWINTPRTF
jgi:DNA-binding transcriptional MerR regulator/quercetin dioxygenase-like cupin family protein